MSAKENIDSGVFTAVQAAAAAAVEMPPEELAARLEVYRARRDLLVGGLERLGWDVFHSPATFYVWTAVPKGWTSMDFAARLISGSGIVVTPGSGFGAQGEGWIRFALTVPEDRISKALGRLEQKQFSSIRNRTGSLVGKGRRCRKEP
jgi:LL-diaminopimelate aminotransferase